MGLIPFLAFPIAFFASWAGLAYFSRVCFPPLQDKRIGLLIAHCDDEAMFFSPTVIALTKPELRNHVQILCLSPGPSHLHLSSVFNVLIQQQVRKDIYATPAKMSY
jgi:N-acetylglucosaminylphosphatidylinositol deacetylase